MIQNMQVRKRDGSLELFDIQKIKRVVIAAGLSEEESNRLVDTIETWMQTLNESIVNARTLRDTVYEELKNIKPYSANLFRWYEKTKER